MEKSLQKIEQEALTDLDKAVSREDVNSLETRYLGRKGVLTAFLRNISKLPVEDRPGAGKDANALKIKLEEAFEEISGRFENQDTGEYVDVTLPGRLALRGSLHPVTKISREIVGIFSRLGFDVVEGPEIETDYYNFEALNIPKYHPARDMQDTFYVSDNIVLRTHTSPHPSLG